VCSGLDSHLVPSGPGHDEHRAELLKLLNAIEITVWDRCELIDQLLRNSIVVLMRPRITVDILRVAARVMGTVNAAFSAKYGQALVEQLGTVLTQSADKACLASKGLDAAKMTARSREIYLRYGAQMLEMVQSFIKIDVLESKFAELAGPGAKAEMLRLQNDPDVKKFLTMARPAQLAHLAETISENLARFALIKRMRLLGPVNEFEVPNKELEDKNPSKGSAADAQRFMEKIKSAQLDRYLDLFVLFDAAKKEAVDRDLVLRNGGPVELFAGVDVDLADLCIPTQQPAPKKP